MNFKLTTALALGTIVAVTSFGTTPEAHATHKIGHAIVGGVIGGIIGGAIVDGVRRRQQPVYVQPAPVYNSLPAAHYNWCFRKYRSYHQPSNTYQPYSGPRRACRSPWW